MAKVQFPDGTTVRAVGIHERDPENPDRDYGLYLDPLWGPSWSADVVEWEDFGLPEHPVDAADKICAAFARARQGQRIEIGCIGGLGRTGTVLACMAVLAGVPPDQAVAWVRRHYDREAVETSEQEHWVQWFAEHTGRPPG